MDTSKESLNKLSQYKLNQTKKFSLLKTMFRKRDNIEIGDPFASRTFIPIA